MTPAFPEPYRAGQTVIVRRGDRVGMVGRIVAALPRGIYVVATESYPQPIHVHDADLYLMARATKGWKPIRDGSEAVLRATSKQRSLAWRQRDRCRTILGWHPAAQPASSATR